ncbi:MAG: aminotransferase class V-fold PLP-dependent enzyme [Chromatiales bacterium]|nr:aminotransferase class V-fold PLP-dependent enzyme [Chromatiales bacterium]
MYARESALTTTAEIREAVLRLGEGALTEQALDSSIRPLFSRVLAGEAGVIYLANHSMGRPLDRTALDLQAAIDAWYAGPDEAWERWLQQMGYFRQQIAELIHAPEADCVVPRASAGQGLRAVLNGFDDRIDVLTSAGEFSSIDLVLKIYAQRGRINLTRVGADAEGHYSMESLVAAISAKTDLLVISLVMFVTGQWLSDLPQLIEIAHEQGAQVVVDLYHAVGALPVDVQALGADFAVGGCYKYLRGGPGAAWLYIDPRHLDGHFHSLDCGWFAQTDPFAFERPVVPDIAPGGNALLESTPAVLPWYQARAGLELTRAIGVERLRDYSLMQQGLLGRLLAEKGIPVFGRPDASGAFVAIADADAAHHARQLLQAGVRADAREGFLRLCPDILNRRAELETAVERLIDIWP